MRTLIREVKNQFISSDYRPPILPSVALQIHQLSRDPDVEIKALVELIETDSFLAAEVLRKAHSPAFLTHVQCQTLQDAVMRLGLGNLRDLVWQVALNMRVFRSKLYAAPMEQLQKHSVTTAHTCRLVSSYTAFQSEYAFLCGLLHDVGLAAAFHVLDRYPPIEDPEQRAALMREIEAMHAPTSELICKLWDLPKDIQMVVGHHHDPKIQGYDHPLASIVCIGQQIAHNLGAGVSFAGLHQFDNGDDKAIESAWQTLGISEQQQALISRAAAETFMKLEL